jgi:hypothetical protein
MSRLPAAFHRRRISRSAIGRSTGAPPTGSAAFLSSALRQTWSYECKKGADPEGSAPLIGYASATGGNMQTAPYQFAENQRDGPRRRINNFRKFPKRTISFGKHHRDVSSRRDYFLFIAAVHGKRNPLPGNINTTRYNRHDMRLANIRRTVRKQIKTVQRVTSEWCEARRVRHYPALSYRCTSMRSRKRSIVPILSRAWSHRSADLV